ncbi:cyclopropane-fatty-acyl-phospholipid synthase family protein [Streptomyces griseus]|uniref:SAM-dependent methyltransferase n=1 Tax=Streptomyces griseus TaxID=1911 RepID=UPI0004C5C585|nr:cyclopropane-fatty-acyl-phospholipid synthase family protein [Streptomyces griseus]
MAPHAAHRIASLAAQALGTPLPLRVRAWDGSESGPQDTPVLVFRHRRALRRLLWNPGELGLARAWVAGEIDVEGDLYSALDQLTAVAPDEDGTDLARRLMRDRIALRLVGGVLRLAGPGMPPAPPAEEAVRRQGTLHTRRRDREAISHHYDVGNEFYAHILGPSMVYSCAYWDRADGCLEDAQYAKLDLICRKLALRPDQHLLDIGCGWGSLVLHAAQHYRVRATGVTISVEQAELARKRVAEAGLTDRIDIRVQDYRDVTDGPYDAISSVGMAEHVGQVRYQTYAKAVYGLLKPGGRLLNHQIARRPLADETSYHVDEFIDRYVFPDGELSPVGSTVSSLEQAGFEVRDVEALREHYALTLRAWVRNLESNLAEAEALTTPGRARIWRLYMAASALAFERNRIGVNQVLAVRTTDDGDSSMPLVRGNWY